MPGQSATGVTIPLGSDGYARMADFKKMSETTRSVIPVANLTARNGLAALFPGAVLPVPTVIARADRGYRLEVWDGAGWTAMAKLVFGQTANEPTILSGEQGVSLNSSGSGAVNLSTPFATAVRSTHFQPTATISGTAVVVRANMTLTTTSQLWFDAYLATTGALVTGSPTLYINYLATGY